MKIIDYNQWSNTAEMLQILSQMLGKVKLQRVPAQPGWAHILLYPTASGFTTGLIPKDSEGFIINLDILESRIYAKTTEGTTAGFKFDDGKSIKEYYNAFRNMLFEVICDTEIYPMPQEMSLKKPFNEDYGKRNYNKDDAKNYHKVATFVYNELTKFAAPYRNKKILPGLFWGTFDITTILYSGEEAPFPGNTIIERSAFDEKLIEFGFWPGDSNYEKPTFFVLPYPFLTEDLSKSPIRPNKAFYSKEKSEFFLSLEDVMNYSNPSKAIQDFFHSAFTILATHERWHNVNWYEKPLLMPIQP